MAARGVRSTCALACILANAKLSVSDPERSEIGNSLMNSGLVYPGPKMRLKRSS